MQLFSLKTQEMLFMKGVYLKLKYKSVFLHF